MGDIQVEFPVVEANGYFNINASTLSVSGPLPDLSIQVAFFDDFMRFSKLKISGEQSTPEQTVLNAVKLEFEGETVRVAYGAVKFNLANAKEMVRLLNEKIAEVEKLTGGAL